MRDNLPAAAGSRQPSKTPRVTEAQAVPLLIEKFGYVVLCFPQPQDWPFNSNDAVGFCVPDYMGYLLDDEYLELSAVTSWEELDETARFLKVGNPIPRDQNALYFRAVLVNNREVEEIEVVRRKEKK